MRESEQTRDPTLREMGEGEHILLEKRICASDGKRCNIN